MIRSLFFAVLAAVLLPHTVHAGLARIMDTGEFEGALFIATAPQGVDTKIRSEVTVIAGDVVTFEKRGAVSGLFLERTLLPSSQTVTPPPTIEVRTEGTFENEASEAALTPNIEQPRLWNTVRAEERVEGTLWRVRHPGIHVRWTVPSMLVPQVLGETCTIVSPLGARYTVRAPCIVTNAMVSVSGSPLVPGTGIIVPQGGGTIEITQ